MLHLAQRSAFPPVTQIVLLLIEVDHPAAAEEIERDRIERFRRLCLDPPQDSKNAIRHEAHEFVNADIPNFGLVPVVTVLNDANLMNRLMTALARTVRTVVVNAMQFPFRFRFIPILGIAECKDGSFEFLKIVALAHERLSLDRRRPGVGVSLDGYKEATYRLRACKSMRCGLPASG